MKHFTTDITNGGYLTKATFIGWVDSHKSKNAFLSSEFNGQSIEYMTYDGTNKNRILELCQLLGFYETTTPLDIVGHEYYYDKPDDFFVTLQLNSTKQYITRGTTLFIISNVNTAEMFVFPTNPDLEFFKSQSIELK
jgi:hypothetical protein